MSLNSKQRGLLRCVVLGLLLGAGGSTAASEEMVRQDLLHTLTLEGYHCGEVVEAEPQAVADYIVTCSNGSHFRVHLTPHGRIEVRDLSGPESSISTPPAHLEIVTSMLTAVVHLADLTCGVVITVVRQGPRDHIATCSDGSRYRVHVSDSGETTVDEQ